MMYAEKRYVIPTCRPSQGYKAKVEEGDVDALTRNEPSPPIGGKGMAREMRPSQSGKGYGGENTQKDKEGHHCGKKGHIKRDSWWRDTPRQEIPKGSGKGAGARGKRKGKAQRRPGTRKTGEVEETLEHDAPEPEGGIRIRDGFPGTVRD